MTKKATKSVRTESAPAYAPATVDTSADDNVIAQAIQILTGRLQVRDVTIGSPSDTTAYLSLKLGACEHEVFCVLFLDNRHRVIEFEEMFRGTIDSTTVYPREVVKQALKHNAAAVIFAHNHPSGVTTPSDADKAITRRLRDALKLVDVRVLDHFVIGGQHVASMARMGMM